MGILIAFFISLATIAGGISAYSYYLTIENKKVLQNYRDADNVTKKVSNIKNLIETESIRGEIKKNSISSIAVLESKPLSQIAVDLNGVQEKALNQYAEAVKIILDTNPNANDSELSCPNLVSTGKIDSDSCTKVANADIKYLSFEQGTIKYDLNDDMSNKVQAIKKNRFEKNYTRTQTEGNITTATEQIVLSPLANKYENKNIQKTLNLVDAAIENNRFIYASQLLSSLDTLNENTSLVPNYRVKIVKKQLQLDGTAIFEQLLDEHGVLQDTHEIKITKQDAQNITQEIKESIIYSLTSTNKAGAQKYALNEEARELIRLIKGDIESHYSSYSNINDSTMAFFLQIAEMVINNNFTENIFIN